MNGRAIIIRLAEITRAVAAQELNPGQLAAHLKELAKWVEESGKEEGESGPVKKERPTAVLEVFEHWLRATKRSGAAFKLTTERRRCIEARLRNYSVGDIKEAIDYVASNPFFQGENDANRRYDDIITICRNDTKLETYRNAGRIDETPGRHRRPSASSDAEDLPTLMAKSREALLRGDNDAYSDAQQRIQRLQLARGGGGHPDSSE